MSFSCLWLWANLPHQLPTTSVLSLQNESLQMIVTRPQPSLAAKYIDKDVRVVNFMQPTTN